MAGLSAGLASHHSKIVKRARRHARFPYPRTPWQLSAAQAKAAPRRAFRYMHIVCILRLWTSFSILPRTKANIRKHGVDLADVEGVFYDPAAITIEDRDHSEQRL